MNISIILTSPYLIGKKIIKSTFNIFTVKCIPRICIFTIIQIKSELIQNLINQTVKFFKDKNGGGGGSPKFIIIHILI